MGLTAAWWFTVLVFFVLTCSRFLKKQQTLHKPVPSESLMDLYCCLCTALGEFGFPSVLFFWCFGDVRDKQKTPGSFSVG